MRAQLMSRYFVGVVTVAALVGSASIARAQSAPTPPTAPTAVSGQPVITRRAALRAKLQAMTPAERKVALATMRHRARQRLRNMTPAQQAWVKSAMTERKTLRSAVKAGSISAAEAKVQRQAWRQANPRPKNSAS